MISKTPILTALTLLLFATASAFADHVENPDKVKVRVREIYGSGMAERGEGAASIEKELKDLKKKLTQLNYQKYKLGGTKTKDVALKTKTDIGLGDGQVLTVRPLYLSPTEHSNRIGMWIHWADKGGMEILDTRMHFSCGESMVTGMENSDKDGKILAIDVTPIN